MGSNNSQSYTERQNSVGKVIVTDKRVSLSAAEMEMVATLRINEPFTTCMKEHHLKAALEYAGLKEAPAVLDDAKKETFNFAQSIGASCSF